MATNDSAGAVFIELGLDFNQLESDFVTADRTIQQNLNRLNRERNLVDLRAQVEIGGMDEAINQTQILETRQRSLNQQLSMQRDRLRLTEAAHRQLVNTQGASAAATQNMESRLQREQLALQRLQQQLERVTAAQNELEAVTVTAAQSSATAAQNGLIEAGQSVQQNLNRLGRELNLTDLRAQVEIGGLDEATNQTQILSIRQRSLNEQLNIQRTRIRLVEEAHRRLSSAQGANSTAAQDMETRLQRERLALQRLEQQLSNVTAAQERLNNASNNTGNTSTGGGSPSNTGGNAGGADNNIGGNVEIGGLDDLANGVLDRIPPQAKAAAAAMAGLGAAIFAAGDASTDLIERWRELQTQSYELNMSVKGTEDFLRKLRLAGGDIGDFEGFIRGISDAMVKAEWDDPEAMVFRRYNETAFDKNGRIKNFQDMTATIERMYEKAKAAGEEIEFLQMLGGESGIRDAIQYLERYKEAEIDKAKIATAGLDPKEFHAAERQLNLYNEQIQEFINALENLITPARVSSLESLFEVFHDGTEYLVENKNEIQRWGFIAAETFDTIADKLSALKSAFDELPDLNLYGLAKDNLPEEVFTLGGFNFLDKAKDSLFGGILERAADRQDKYNRAVSDGTETQSKYSAKVAESSATQNENTNKVEDGKNSWADFRHEQEQGTVSFADFRKVQEQSTKSWADFRREQEQGVQTTKDITAATKEATAAKQKEIDVLQQYSIQRTVALRDELEEVKLENQNFKHGYDLEVAKLALERNRARRQNVLSTAESTAIDELYAEKRLLLEKETQDKLDDLRDEATEEFKSDLEKRNIEIKNSMEDWIDAGMKEAEAEKYAQALKVKAIEDWNDEVAENIDSIWQTSLENRLAEIDREKQEWIDKGLEKVKATQWAEQAKTDAIEDLEKEWNARVLEINGSALEQKLANIEREKQAWIDKGIAEVEAEQLAQQQKAQLYQQEYESALQAEQNAAQNVESAENALNDALEQREDLRQRIAEQQAKEITQAEQGLQVLKSQLEAFRAYRDKGEKGVQEYYLKELRKQGITDKDLKMTPAQLQGFQQASRDVQKGLMPNLAQFAPPNPEMLKQLSKLDDRIAKLQQALKDAQEELKKAREKRKEAAAAKKEHPITDDEGRPTNSFDLTKDKLPKNPIMITRDSEGSLHAQNFNPQSKTPEEIEQIRKETNKFLFGVENPTTYLTNAPTNEDFKKSLDSAGNSVEDFKKKLEGVPETSELPKTEMPATAADLPSPVPDFDFSNIAAKFDILPPIIENIGNGFNDLSSKITDVSTAFSNLVYTFQNTNIGQADIAAAPVDFSSLTQQAAEILSAIQTGATSIETAITNQQQVAPPNVTNNISIQEAHAWDYEHINELAERVADVIEPKILAAIGGNSNGY